MITRITACLALGPLGFAGGAETAPADSPVTLTTATRTLHGSLLLPAAAVPALAKVPGVRMIAGSGPTDGDGNRAGLPGPNHSLKLLAQGLAQGDWASLRYDKRGETVADAQALQAARAGVEMSVIDGMNHLPNPVPADKPWQRASYSHPALPLARTLVPRLLHFLKPLGLLASRAASASGAAPR